MLHGLIDIPTLYYFQEKNIWTGSLFKTFNYRISPVFTDEKKEIACKIWYGMLCYDLTESFVSECHEPMTEEGLKNIIDFINTSALKYKETH